MAVRIRRAEAEDFPAIEALYGDLYGLLSAMGLPFDLDRDALMNLLPSVAASRMCCLVVAEADGRLAGFLYAGLSRMDRKLTLENGPLLGVVHDICVAEDVRGSGTAAALLQYAEDWLWESGAAAVKCDIVLENARSLRFFEKHGYAPFCRTLLKKRER